MTDIKLPPPQYLGDVLGYTAEQVRQMVLMERRRVSQWMHSQSVELDALHRVSNSKDALHSICTEAVFLRKYAAAISEQSLRELNRLSEEMGEVK